MSKDIKDSSFWKNIEYLFCGFFVAFPFLNYTTYLYGGSATRSINLIAFSALLGLAYAGWVVVKRGKGLTLWLSPPFIVLALYLASLSLSGVLGLSWQSTFWSMATRTTGVWYFLSLGIFMAMLWPVVSELQGRSRLVLSILFSTALYSVLALFGPEGFGLIFTSYKGDAFTFANSTFAAMYIFGAFMLSVYYLVQAEKKVWWMYALPVVLVVNPSIINPLVWSGNFSNGVVGEAQASTYTILLSLVALCGAWGISKLKNAGLRARVSYGALALSAVLAIVAGYSLMSPQGYLREAYLSRGTAARPLVWHMSEKAIAERPLLGWGADNFERVFERLYDNRLLQDEYGNEAWFDRAHNVIVDQLVDNGAIGFVLYLLVYAVLLLTLAYVALNAEQREDRVLATMLGVYFALHVVELQTAFDTSISYPMLAVLFVLSATLFQRTWKGFGSGAYKVPEAVAYGIVALVALFSVWSLFAGVIPFANAQSANGAVRTVGSAEKRIPYYPTLFASPVDVHAFLWRTSTDFQRGIAENPKVLEDSKKVEGLKKEAVIFEQGYREYIRENPSNFRVHLNLADILMYQRLFGVDKLAEAQQVLDTAIALVPESPQPYWMKAVGYIYMRKFDLAREYAKKGLALNPQIKQSQTVMKYVEDSIKTFPEIDLFFFKQI